MRNSTRSPTDSETIISASGAPESTGIPSLKTGSDETRETADAMLERVAATAAKHEAAREARRANAIASAPWTKLLFEEFLDEEWSAPTAICEDIGHATFPPSLTADQSEECVAALASYGEAVRPADPKALAVILHTLAACVILPDKGDMDLAMQAYIEDLQHIPERILADACKRWRRQSKFWPTIAELLAECRHLKPWQQKGEDDYSEAKRAYLRCAVLDSIRRNPAPGCIITRRWLRHRQTDADLRLHDATKPARVQLEDSGRLKLVNG